MPRPAPHVSLILRPQNSLRTPGGRRWADHTRLHTRPYAYRLHPRGKQNTHEDRLRVVSLNLYRFYYWIHRFDVLLFRLYCPIPRHASPVVSFPSVLILLAHFVVDIHIRPAPQPFPSLCLDFTSTPL